jgi:ABC-type glycerol-3-phosphate transport system permease component
VAETRERSNNCLGVTCRVATTRRRRGLAIGYFSQRRIFLAFSTAVMLIYSVLTLFPFYVLFVRTFVSTREAATLHLWIPEARPISLDAEIGNLAVYYNLDLKKVKADLGITGYLGARKTLQEIAEQYNMPPERFVEYFRSFDVYNGWITMLLANSEYWLALGRTVVITAGSLFGLIILSIFTGYGLAGLRRRDQMFIYNLYVLQMVIPAMLIIVPQFVLVQWLQALIPGTNSPGATRYIVQMISLIVINIKGGALSTMIFTAAISAIPRDLEDAALIDGASRFDYFRYVMLPLLRVPIASLTVIMLPAFWNQFLEGYVYLDSANTTVLPLIQGISGQFSTNYQMIYTGVFVSILPLVLVYLAFRQFFIRGVMAGAVKG